MSSLQVGIAIKLFLYMLGCRFYSLFTFPLNPTV